MSELLAFYGLNPFQVVGLACLAVVYGGALWLALRGPRDDHHE